MTLGTRILPVVALALLSATEAISGISDQSIRSPGGSVLSVPIGSPAQFASFGQHEAARFKGRFKLQGTYRYGYLTNDPDADSIYGVLELTFDPDPSYVAKLPFWSEFQLPVHLRVSNLTAFARAVVSRDTLAKLRRKEIFSVTGKARVLVDGYKAWLECDSAHYSVRFEAVVQPQPTHLTQAFAHRYGC